MIFGSLFSGIGGIDLGLEACGLTVGWQCEADPFRQSVLRARFPSVPLYPDANTIKPPPCDIIAGGSPCQDFAAHGSGLGLNGARSGLWRAFVRCIAAANPRIVFFENVANVLKSRDGHDFGVILEDLAGLGFDATWGVFRASEAGLSHRRRRLFLLAYTGQGRLSLHGQAHDDDGHQSRGIDLDRRDALGDAPPGPDDLDSLAAWVAEHPGALPGIRRDLAGIPDRVDRVAALGDTAPPPLVALAWRTLRDRVLADARASRSSRALGGTRTGA